MDSSNRIVMAEKALHQINKRMQIRASGRGRGYDLAIYDEVPLEPSAPGAERVPFPHERRVQQKFFETEREAHSYMDFRRAEAVVAALDAFPQTVETFFERFEEDFYKNYESSEATDESRMLAKAIFKPLVAWWEAGQEKRKSTPSGMTLAMARLFGFFLYTVNAATITRESGQRLEGLADLVLDVRHAAQAFQAEDDREGFEEVDLLDKDPEAAEREAFMGGEQWTPEQLAAMKAKGNA